MIAMPLRGCVFVIGVCLLSQLSTLQAQTKPAVPPAKPTVKVDAPKIPTGCPDVEYQQACASYAELIAAKDPAMILRADKNFVTLVCFRPKEDSFFVFSVSVPSLWSNTVTDKLSGRTSPSPDATAAALGFVAEFVDGISGHRSMPLEMFIGDWAVPATPYFEATQINNRDLAEDESVVVTVAQITAYVNYANREDKKLNYQLRLQRSTGRYTEQYKDASSKLPFLENRGRCVSPSAFK